MKRLFESKAHALKYASFRPTYPESVFEAISDFCAARNNNFDTAVDVGCGSGQSTIPLAKYFKRVYGTDVSEAQLLAAKSRPANLTFKASPAESMPFLQNGTVSLVTCAQALHWLHLDTFYAEIRRILHPKSGVLTVYGYGNVKLDNTRANSIISEFYTGTVGKYWDPQRSHIDDHYQRFSFPCKDFHRNDDLVLKKSLTVDEFIGYVGTWSAYQTFMKEQPESKVLEEIHQKLVDLYGKPDSTVEATWPLFMLLGSGFT